MPEPMTDNARIVREALEAARPLLEHGFQEIHADVYSRALQQLYDSFDALTTLETELATAKSDLARARGTQAAQDVLAERRRQIEAEGWRPEHDDLHDDNEMAAAAACYAVAGCNPDPFKVNPPAMWPWDWAFWKPASQRRNLVKAGALILAEIERLDRAALAPEQKGE